MEAEVGTPIEYNPDEFINKNSTGLIDEEQEEQHDEPVDDKYYSHPAQHQVYYNPQPQYQEKNDIFTNLDKTGYIIIFVAFLLGFFMGKTMQPVILRPG
tara:strand:+ start:829 stop:1125 length:297 start_codon:yes stop_codon:yes gene_type:complete